MAANPHSTIPLDVSPNSHENVSSATQDQEFIDSITGGVSPEARRRLAADTRRALATVDLIPSSSLHDSPAAYDADDLRKDITRALAYIDIDDLFALACLCDRFALCPEAH
jgi:hypothetical protein